MKLQVDKDGNARFKCPGCDVWHHLTVKPLAPNGWGYNGDPDNPTITPSILERSGHFCSGMPQPPECKYCDWKKAGDDFYNCYLCHSFIRDGKIQFLDDCTHALAGRTVELPEIPLEV